jgi:hypothetical protein
VDIFGSSQPVMRPGLDSLNNVYACLHSEEGKEGLDLYSKVRISCFPWKKKQGASARTWRLVCLHHPR